MALLLLGFIRHIIDTKMWAAEDVALVDWDGDGDNDLLATAYDDADYDGCVVFYRWVGFNQFEEHALVSDTRIGPYKIFIVDMDRDGDPDAVVTALVEGSAGPILFWLENQGDGTVQVHEVFWGTSMVTGKVPVAFDADGDGDYDIAMTTFDYSDSLHWGAVMLFVNQGDNLTFAPETLLAGKEPRALQTADVDGDGDVDLLCGFLREDSLFLLRNDGSGHFTPEFLGEMPNPYYGFGYVDIDGDGHGDWAVASSDSSLHAGFYWFKGSATTPWVGHRVVGAQSGGWIETVVAADVDLDGDPDFYSGGAQSNVWWFENEGGGLFTPHLIDTIPFVMDGSHAGDVEQDGDPDLMGGSVDYGYVIWWENEATPVAEGAPGKRPLPFELSGSALEALDALEVYDASGRLLASLRRGQSLRLGQGVYLVLAGGRAYKLVR